MSFCVWQKVSSFIEQVDVSDRDRQQRHCLIVVREFLYTNRNDRSQC